MGTGREPTPTEPASHTARLVARVESLEADRVLLEDLLDTLPRILAAPGGPTELGARTAELMGRATSAAAAFFATSLDDRASFTGDHGPVRGSFEEPPRLEEAPLLAAAFDAPDGFVVDDVARLAPSPSARRPYGTLWGGALARSWLAVPVRTPGRDSHGVLFACHPEPRAFGRGDLHLAVTLAAHLALVLDWQQLAENRARVVDALQQSLLPPFLPEIKGLELAARYRPTGAGNLVGGDFFDVFPLEDGSFDLVLGDVSGVGPEAAAVTGVARSTLRAVTSPNRAPSQALAALNQAIIALQEPERFCTAIYAHIHLAGDPPNDAPSSPPGTALTLGVAGHPPALVVGEDGAVRRPGGRPGPLLGVLEDPHFEDTPLVLAHGEALVLYTDGVLEAPGPGGDQLGEDRLIELLSSCAGRTASGIARRVELAVIDYEDGPPRDDVTVLVLRATGAP